MTTDLEPDKLYDSMCYCLAKSFCDDNNIFDEAAYDELAQQIQQTIEDFLEEKQDG